MIKRQTSITKNIVQFCRFLREHEFAVGVEEEMAALNALQLIDFTSPAVFRLSLKATLARSEKEFFAFDRLYEEYWSELAKAIDSKIKSDNKPVVKPVSGEVIFKSLKSWLNGSRNEQKTEEVASYSTGHDRMQLDFSSVPADELDEFMSNVKALSKRLATILHRRHKNAHHKNVPDLRRTLRRNMRHGGEFMEIAFREPKRTRTRLVILCDVSKSMDLYTSFLIQFMFAFQQVYRKIETFGFSTSLQHITNILRQDEFSRVLRLLGEENTSWSGGTRIGESLDSFIHDYPGLLNKRTIVIIVSDGWDTGNIPLLQQSMEHIHRRSKKVIWLNPLAGYHAYSPEVAGMKAALPYIDVFASVHNLASLKKLADWL